MYLYIPDVSMNFIYTPNVDMYVSVHSPCINAFVFTHNAAM
jgi:hypothetical protein